VPDTIAGPPTGPSLHADVADLLRWVSASEAEGAVAALQQLRDLRLERVQATRLAFQIVRPSRGWLEDCFGHGATNPTPERPYTAGAAAAPA
jgi:hypothetical protein